MTVNMPMLRGRMVEKSITVTKLAHALNIDTSTLYRKFKDQGVTLTVGEMHGIISTLQLNKEDASCIFLFENSQKREN